MATPTNNYYSAASGTAQLGLGVAIYPNWRKGQVPGTWRQVSTSKLSDVDPKFNAAYNPNGAGATAPWSASSGQQAVIDAWCGAVFDQVASKFWIPLGGGHSNYAGNEPYMLDISAASPAWSMVRPPSGAIGYNPSINLNDGQETTGVYSDGRLRSAHTYNNLTYVPGLGIVVYQLSGIYSTANGSANVFVINPTTGEVTGPVAAISNAGIGNTGFGNPGYAYVGCVHVPNRNRVYGLGNGSTVLLTYVNIGAPNATWSAGFVGSAKGLMGAYGKPLYIPTLDKMLAITTGGVLALYDLDTGAAISPVVTGTAPSGFVFDGPTGADWCPELNCVLMWNNSANTTAITTLTPDATGANWVVGALTVSGSNTVTPSTMSPQGTYGRFAYSQRLKGCVLLNNNEQPTYFFATE